MKPRFPRLFLLLLALLFALNLIQSATTELIFDEAYYWYYAREMAWGYFDHPPLVAFLIEIGGWFFEGELGVRFMSCLLSAGTAMVVWLLIEDPNKEKFIPHFFLLLFSMTLLNAYGFLMLPDTPLLFFTALFLLMYKSFLRKPATGTAMALGVVMAALMYSKYHALLVILLVILSNPGLLRNSKAWMAAGLALLCYTPHFIWLFDNNFISIKYHLFERPNRAYEFMDFTAGYFLNLIALFGLTFPWIYLALFRSRSRDLFSRALLFLTYGVLLFFFVSSFQRRVQTQWLIVICIPLAVLVFNYIMNNEGSRRWVLRMALLNCGILLFLRIGLVYEPVFPISFETHGNRKWVQDIVSKAGNIPVVFENSYREAPMYSFYSGNPSYSLNNIFYRQNQYSIDKSEARMQGRKILLVAKRFKKGDLSYIGPGGKELYGQFRENFRSARKLECLVDQPGKGESGILLRVYNPYPDPLPLKDIKFGLAYLNTYKQLAEIREIPVGTSESGTAYLQPGDTTDFRVARPRPGNAADKFYRFTLSEFGHVWGLNGSIQKFQ